MKHTYYKGKAEALVVSSKEIGLEVDADKTKYTVISWDKNAGWRQSLIIISLKRWKRSHIWEQP